MAIRVKNIYIKRVPLPTGNGPGGTLLVRRILFLLFIVSSFFANAQKLIVPIGHSNYLDQAAFSPDGKRAITGSGDGEVKLWDVATGLLIADLNGYNRFPRFFPDGSKILTEGLNLTTINTWDAVTGNFISSQPCYMPSPDCRYAAFTGADSSVRILDIPSKQEWVHIFKAQGEVNWITFASDSKKIAGVSDSALKAWDIISGTELLSLDHLQDNIHELTFSPDGKTIILGFSNGEIEAWNFRSKKKTVLRKRSTGYNDAIDLTFSDDGKWLAAVSRDSSLEIWNFPASRLITRITDIGNYVMPLKFSPGNQNIIASPTSNSLIVYDVITGRPLVTIKRDNREINMADFSPDGSKIITALNDGTADIWDAASGLLLHNLAGHTSWLTSGQFSHDGKKILTTAGSVATIWNKLSENIQSNIKGHYATVRSAEFFNDNEFIITTSNDGYAVIWDGDNGNIMKVLKGHTDAVTCSALSADNYKAITGSVDGTAKVWDVVTGNLLLDLKSPKPPDSVVTMTISTADHAGGVSYVAFSPDNKKILTVGYSAALWDAENGTLLKNFENYNAQTWWARFSPDGKKLVTVPGDGTVKLWDANSYELLRSIEINQPVNSASFSPGGKQIIITSDSIGRVWQLEESNPVLKLKGHTGKLKFGIFSPDGKRILTGSEDNTAILWDAATGDIISRLKGHMSYVKGGCFSPDGNEVLTISNDNTCKVWNGLNGELLYTFFLLDGNDFFIGLPGGYYQTTQNAAKLLHYVTRDLKVITFEQLDLKYNRPDKVLEAIGNTDTTLINSYRRAYAKRISRLGFDTTQFAGSLNVPEADFVNRNKIEYEHRDNKLTLHIGAKDSIYQLDRFNVWINESPLFGSRGLSLKWRDKNDFDTTFTVSLSDSLNIIETSVTNTSGLESYRMPLQVLYKPGLKQSSRLYFVGIGIDHFKDSLHNLQWSVKDVRDLADSLKNKYGNDILIDTLFNAQVTTSNIMLLKKKLSQSTVNDKVILSYSGHGLLSSDYDYYLSTYDVNFHKPGEGGLPYEALQNLLDSIPARKKLMLIDACHSGEVDKEEMQHYRTVMKSNDNKGLKGGELENTQDSAKLGMKNSFELMQQLFVNVGRSTGATIISAAAATQLAQERGDLRNGVFTYSILEYMKDHPSCTVTELKQYVNKRVPELTNGLQQPTARSETKQVDWEVW
jgi:WD40 repeat protein